MHSMDRNAGGWLGVARAGALVLGVALAGPSAWASEAGEAFEDASFLREAPADPPEQVALAPEIVAVPRGNARTASDADRTLPTVDVREKRDPFLLDMRAWRDVPVANDEPMLSPLVRLIRERHPWMAPKAATPPGFKLSRSKKGFVTDYKFIGIQLENGGRITIRRKNGVPTLMYRQKF